MNICEYGCGKEGKYFFKRVKKWCCSKSFQACPAFKKKYEKICFEKYGVKNISQLNETKCHMRKSKNVYYKIPIDKNILCEYGCGKPARYIINIQDQKFCCSKYYNRCEAIRLINKEKSGIGNREKSKRKIHSEFMKKENPMFINENKEMFMKSVTSDYYKETMSTILLNLWEDDEFKEKVLQGRIRSGSQVHPDEVIKFKKYRSKVHHYTRKSIRDYVDIINPENKCIGIKEGMHNVDHIYSIFDGFNNNVSPKIVGSYINLQVIPWKDNLKKQRNSWITKNNLYKRYKTIENI